MIFKREQRYWDLIIIQVIQLIPNEANESIFDGWKILEPEEPNWQVIPIFIESAE